MTVLNLDLLTLVIFNHYTFQVLLVTSEYIFCSLIYSIHYLFNIRHCVYRAKERIASPKRHNLWCRYTCKQTSTMWVIQAPMEITKGTRICSWDIGRKGSNPLLGTRNWVIIQDTPEEAEASAKLRIRIRLSDQRWCIHERTSQTQPL